jgi:hypothetical protein
MCRLFLFNHLPDLLHNLRLHQPQNKQFMYSGATILYSALSTEIQWTVDGRGGPVDWPARSSENKAVGFWLLEFVKILCIRVQPWQLISSRQAVRGKLGMFESCVCVCVFVCADNTHVIIRCDVVQVVLTRRLEVLCVCVGTPVCCNCW